MEFESVDRELDWFFNQADSDMGLHSSWDAMVQIALSGGGANDAASCPDPMSEKRIEASWRQRGIQKRLNELPKRLESVLRHTFEDGRRPPELLSKYAHLAGLVGVTPTAISLAAKDCGGRPPWEKVVQWVTGAVNREEVETVETIRAEAALMLKEAIDAYKKSSRGSDPLQH